MNSPSSQFNRISALITFWGHARSASLPACCAGGSVDLQLVGFVCSLGEPRSTTRGNHQSPVVNVFGGAQNRTRGPDDDHADRTTRRFRQGSGSIDARLRLASRVGCASYGAVESNHRLEPRLRPYQACYRQHRASAIHPITCKCGRLTTSFRLISGRKKIGLSAYMFFAGFMLQ